MSEVEAKDPVLAMVEEAELLRDVRIKYAETDSYQGQLNQSYQRLHHYYNPPNGDQWPEDLVQRPGKIHITENLVKAAVDVDARLQSILPRISLQTKGADDETLRRAEAAEALFIEWLELSGWDEWMSIYCQSRSLLGKGVLKPIWVGEDKRPDVEVIENPANLRIGWGSSNYKVKDWALYEYSVSPIEAMRRWPNIVITNPDKGKADKPLSIVKSGDHTDPLGQKAPVAPGSAASSTLRPMPMPYQPSDYEQKQVLVWDYWYKKPNGTVCNTIIVGKSVVALGPVEHPEYPDIPYIVSENDHDLGNPEGVSTAAPIIDLQIEYNRAISHWAQLVADEIDPAWQLTGDNADSVPAGTVPKGGEIIAAGSGNEIKPLPKGVNQFPLAELVQRFWSDFHKLTGLSEILFGDTPSADISGRALAVQVQAAINRLDPRRRRLYRSLRELLIFWAYMVEKVDPQVAVTLPDEEGNLAEQQVGVKSLVQGFRRWKIVAPEITPRDLLDSTMNVSNKVNAKLQSLRTSMDELGVDSPEKEIDLIKKERMDASLFPGDVNAYIAVMAAMQTMQQNQAAMQQQIAAMQADAKGQQQAAAQQAQPQGIQGDNAESPGMPATAAGGPPPANGQGPIAGTTLIRAQPGGGAQVLNQLAIQQKY